MLEYTYVCTHIYTVHTICILRVISSAAQESAYYPMSSQSGLFSQAPVLVQAQTTPLSQQAPSLSVTSDTIAPPLWLSGSLS